ncbi:hypothetical protein SDC9_130476 [bioreactor metagenome]|uniref:Uncharacterized protein n=1 Tax=bioreactor metagenome TaxID=1076179 RepID=A0A645D447_9ZZZZ
MIFRFIRYFVRGGTKFIEVEGEPLEPEARWQYEEELALAEAAGNDDNKE